MAWILSAETTGPVLPPPKTLILESVITDAAADDPFVLDEQVPSAWHHVERYANKPVDADHRLTRTPATADVPTADQRTARVIVSGHAFTKNLRTRPLRTPERPCPDHTGRPRICRTRP